MPYLVVVVISGSYSDEASITAAINAFKDMIAVIAPTIHVVGTRFSLEQKG